MNSTRNNTTPLSSSQTELTLEDALAELEQVKQQRFVRPQGAKTAQEWADAWGIGIGKARRIIGGLIGSARMRSICQPITDIGGRTNHTYVYQVINEHQGQA